MDTPKTIVIVGGGHAGYQVINALRQEGFSGPLILFEAQAAMPYQRPPLSKAYLLNELSAERLSFRPAAFYEQHKITLIHHQVMSINPERKVVYYDGGQACRYDELIMAVGSEPRTLEVSTELSAPHVHYLGTIADANKLKKQLLTTERVVVVGAGFIGLEFASVAQKLGVKHITVLDQAARVMQRTASAAFAQAIMQKHQAAGIQFCLNTQVTEIVISRVVKEGIRWHTQQNGYGKHLIKASRLEGVRLSDASFLRADMIVMGIGSAPNVGIARAAGLLINNGIAVDQHLSTSDPFIYAIGDCARFPVAGAEPMRLESVQNAVDQARYLAKYLTGKTLMPYQAIPWFWSNQFDMNIQIAGVLPKVGETIVLEEASSELTLVVLTYAGGILKAIESINHPLAHMAGRRLLALPESKRPTVRDVRKAGFLFHDWQANIIL